MFTSIYSISVLSVGFFAAYWVRHRDKQSPAHHRPLHLLAALRKTQTWRRHVD